MKAITIGELLDQGIITKKTLVIGDITKQITADGCIAAVNSELWMKNNLNNVDWPKQCLGPCPPCVPMSCLYGIREYAENLMNNTENTK